MKKLVLCALLILSVSIGIAQAQNTLNLHQKSGGVVSYCFADKPVVTYVGDNLHVSTNSLRIDYPLLVLEKMTFSDGGSSIGELRIGDPSTPIQVYDAKGTLLKMIKETEDDSTINIQELPAGIYFIMQGTVTTKIIKQ